MSTKTKTTPKPKASPRRRAIWELAGVVRVDTGALVVGDPCSVADECDASDNASAALEKNGFFQSGNTVLISTGIGDGNYAVQVRRGAHPFAAGVKIITALRIDFTHRLPVK
jgi:hypothetical protein